MPDFSPGRTRPRTPPQLQPFDEVCSELCESLRLLCTDLVKKLFPVFPSMCWKFDLTLACAPSFSQSGHGSIESNLKITLLRANPSPRLSPLLHRWLLALSVAVSQRGAAATSSASLLRTRPRAKLACASECLTAATHAHRRRTFLLPPLSPPQSSRARRV